MTMRIVWPVLAALALAGCGSAGDERGVANGNAGAEANAVGNMAGGENALAAVLAMSDRQRNVVFIRALMDAGIDCQSVVSSSRLPDQDGKPLWRANCSDKRSHMISITPDGTANIVSRTDR
ncbi:hypothetical protein [Sphingomonas psychrotolerans]|uniref:Lipoprotein n=1 Tax=Sphingomonas psychrotolerans TaxID=1327635 RepID=A0A2K8MKV4_9SPHN|nr:hypothetical protein [Sphingomonas psychrotolerans]ATY34508.1 hypothetical protein CVN68_08630 [Sphingomonas psychrotolerans]